MKMDWKLQLATVVACGLMFGCGGGSDTGFTELQPEENVENTEAHAHEHGPHGGHILELGDQHAEIAMGTDRVVSVYLLGADAKTATPVANATAHLHLHIGEAEEEVELTASPLEGEPEGQSSRFVSTAEAIPAAIADIEGIEGEVIVMIDGAEKMAEIGHDHGAEHADHKH